MAKILLKRTLALGLAITDDEGSAVLKKLKPSEEVWCEIKKARNPKHHRQYFALLHLVFENQERYRHFEHFRKAVQIAAGHVDELITLTGEVVLIPKSVDYASLDEIEFSKVFSETMAVCCDSFLQGVDQRFVLDEVGRYAA